MIDPAFLQQCSGLAAHQSDSLDCCLSLSNASDEIQTVAAVRRAVRHLRPLSFDTVAAESDLDLPPVAARALETGDRRHEPLLYLLRNANSKLADGVYRDVGLKHKKAKKWAKAVECLRQIARSESFDNELRFELSVCNVKQSAKDLAPHLRAEDHALRGFQTLLQDKGFKLFERLKKERALTAADLYYIGFHFSEGTGAELKFGRKTLEHVAKRWPKTKEGKAAKSKLKLAPQQQQSITPVPTAGTGQNS